MVIDRPVSCHLVAWPSLHEGVAAVSSLGFAGCEAMAASVRQHGAALGDVLAGAGLRLSAVYATGSFTAADADARRALVADCVAVARLAASLGCDRLVVGAGPWRGWARPDMRVVAAAVQEVARAVADCGVVACLHPHRASEVAAGDEVRAVLDRDASGFVAVCPDTGHLAVAGDDAAAVIRACAERVAAVHVKDVAADGRVCALGEGVVDVAGVFSALDDIGYHGWATVEVQDADAPTAAVRTSRDCLIGLGRWPAAAIPA